MKTPRVTTQLVGLTPRDWQQIEAAAIALTRSCPEGYNPAGTLILPGRPEVLKLTWRGSGFVLEVVQ